MRVLKIMVFIIKVANVLLATILNSLITIRNSVKIVVMAAKVVRV